MEKLMELKTVQTNSFKILSDALKEILTDVNAEFSPAGMKLVSMDQETRTILVHLKYINDGSIWPHSCHMLALYNKYLAHICRHLKSKVPPRIHNGML